MSTFYVKDGNLIKYFKSVAEVVSFLEKVVEVKFGTTRNVYMQNIIDLGHGYDDPLGRTFTEALADNLEIGVIKDGQHVRCNIHEAHLFQKPEYGN